MFVSDHRLRQCSAGFGLTLAARCPKTRLRSAAPWPRAHRSKRTTTTTSLTTHTVFHSFTRRLAPITTRALWT